MKVLLICTVLLCFITFTTAQRISSQSGCIKIENVADYKAFVETAEGRANFIMQSANQGVSTLSKLNDQKNEELPEFLLAFLNADNIGIIGNYFVKLDFDAQKCFVVNTATTNAYNNLKSNNEKGEKVISVNFDTNVDGIELLEGLESGTITPENFTSSLENGDGSTQRCRTIEGKVKELVAWSVLKIDENNLNHKIINNVVVNCSGDDIQYIGDYKLVYQNLFIYFRLQGKHISQHRCNGSAPLWPDEVRKDIKMTGKLSYTLRCREVINAGYDESIYGKILTWSAYDGWRKVSAVNWVTDFSIKHTWEPNYVTSSLQLIR